MCCCDAGLTDPAKQTNKKETIDVSTSHPDMLRTIAEILQGPGNSCIPQLDPAAVNTPAHHSTFTFYCMCT